MGEDLNILFHSYVLEQPANYRSHMSVATFERDKCINVMLCKGAGVKHNGLERQAISYTKIMEWH